MDGHVVVNESVLTGESIPVVKTPLPRYSENGKLFDVDTHGKHCLYAGTRIVAAPTSSIKEEGGAGKQ